jgi:hypothetical protein
MFREAYRKRRCIVAIDGFFARLLRQLIAAGNKDDVLDLISSRESWGFLGRIASRRAFLLLSSAHVNELRFRRGDHRTAWHNPMAAPAPPAVGLARHLSRRPNSPGRRFFIAATPRWCERCPLRSTHGVRTAAHVTGPRCRTGDAACTVDLAPDLARQRDWRGRAGPTGSTGTTRPRPRECGEMHASSIGYFGN